MSASRSSGSSRPIEIRAMLGVTPARASSSSEWPHCDVSTGRLQRLSTPPRLAARLIDSVAGRRIAPRDRSRRRDRGRPSRQSRSSGASRSRDRGATRGPGSRRARRARAARAALAMASALAFCRSTRTASVLSPLPSAYAAYGSRTAPTSFRALSTLLDDLARSGQHPGSHVAVPIEVLRGAVHDDVDAEGQRLLIDRAGEGVVDDRE